MKSYWTFAVVAFCCLFLFACGEEPGGSGAGATPTDQPPGPGKQDNPAAVSKAPADFWVQSREYGATLPYDNSYYISRDSCSKKAFYYNLVNITTFSVSEAEIDQLFQDLMEFKASEVIHRTDSNGNGLYGRPGEAFEMHWNGQHHFVANMDSFFIQEPHSQAFLNICGAVRNLANNKLSEQLVRVDLDINGTEGENITEIDIKINDFPLVNWNSNTSEAPLPSAGYNSVVPGDYFVYCKVLYGEKIIFKEDTLQVRSSRRFAVDLSNSKPNFKK